MTKSAKIKHKAIYTNHSGWGNPTEYKVYDYADGVDLTQKQFYDSYVVNVPCYKVEDITLAATGTKSDYFCPHTQMRLFGNFIRMETNNRRGKKFYYLLATPGVDEYVKQQSVFGAIKGHISKVPVKHYKTVRVFNRGKYNNYVKVDCSIQEKTFDEYLTK